MKYLISLFTCLLLFQVAIASQQPEKIYPYTEVEMSGDYYKTQAKLWKNIIEEDKSNVNAWFNFYFASRYARAFGGDKSVDLKQIAKNAWEAIPNTFEGHYIMYSSDQWNPDVAEHLVKAYEIAPNRYETYHSLINKYILELQPAKVKEFVDKIYAKEKYSSGALAWNYNLLQSVGDDGILITHGDNDTYPAWMLQYGKGVREDVTVLNIHLLGVEEYTTKLFEEMDMPPFENWTEDMNELHQRLVQHLITHSKRDVYLSTTTRHELRRAFKENLYLTGLAYKYSKEHFDNIAIVKNNYDNRFAMDYIRFDLTQEVGQAIIDKMNMAYTSSMLLLYHHSKKSDDKRKAEMLKKLILKIAILNDRENEFKKYFGHSETNLREYPELNIKKLEKNFKKVDGALWASSTELKIGDYDQFLMDLVKNREFEKLATCKVEKTDWRALLHDSHKDLSDKIVFEHGHPDEATMPIQNISHEAAILYCEWLTGVYNQSDYKKKKFKKVVFKLPTAEEWVLAAEANRKDIPYPWGGYFYKNAKSCYLSNFNVTSQEGCEECPEEATANDGGFFTVPVDAYFPNDFGCYGMSGNVAEMVAEKGIAKGGSWEDKPENCTIQAIKKYDAPSIAIGFRVFMQVVE